MVAAGKCQPIDANNDHHAQEAGRRPRRDPADRLRGLQARRAARRQDEAAGVLLREHRVRRVAPRRREGAITAGYTNVEGDAGGDRRLGQGRRRRQRRGLRPSTSGVCATTPSVSRSRSTRARDLRISPARAGACSIADAAAQLDDRARELEHGDLAAGADVRDDARVAVARAPRRSRARRRRRRRSRASARRRRRSSSGRPARARSAKIEITPEYGLDGSWRGPYTLKKRSAVVGDAVHARVVVERVLGRELVDAVRRHRRGTARPRATGSSATSP